MKIAIRTDLLAAVAKWSSSDDSRPQLQVVLFDQHRMVATDGHRIVIAPFEEDVPKFALHRDDCAAIAAAQRALPKYLHHGNIRISIQGDQGGRAVVALDEGDIRTMVVKAHDGKTYPPFEQVLPTKKETETPGEFLFDQRYLSAIDEVVRAAGLCDGGGGVGGVRIKAWSAIDATGMCGPMLFESRGGIQFAIMPMRAAS